MSKREFLENFAFGHHFSSLSAQRAIDLVEAFLDLPKKEHSFKFKEVQETIDNYFDKGGQEARNVYLILSGFAIVNNLTDIYSKCQLKLGKKSLGRWRVAVLRTDDKMRRLLNFALHCAILTCNAKQVDHVLTWARQNTLIL